MNNNFDPSELNSEVRSWARDSAFMMKTRVNLLTNKGKFQFIQTKKISSISSALYSMRKNKKLVETITSKVNNRMGVAERIIFPFAKHGFFIAVGVSRGHSKNNPRKKIDWYNFIFEDRIEKLADIVAEKYADASINYYSLNVNENGKN